MPVEVSFKKMTKRGRKRREIDVETFSIDHQASMTVLELKKAVEKKVNEASYGFSVYGEGELDVKTGGQCLENDTVISDGDAVVVVFTDLMLRLDFAMSDFAKTDAGKKAQKAWEEALRGSDASASSEPPVPETPVPETPVPETVIDQNATASSDAPAVEGRDDGLRKVTYQSIHGVRTVDAYLITYIQNMPHVSTDYGIYQVSKHFTQTRNCLVLNQDEDEERVPSADDDSSADDIFIEVVSDGEQSVPETSTTVPEGGALDAITEPEAETTGAHFALTVADRRTSTTQIHHITSAPNVSLANLRDRIVTDTLGLPLSQAKGFNFTRVRADTMVANFRPHVKSMLVDGDEIAVTVRARGGGARAVSKQTKKDMSAKATEYKKAIAEASSLINRQSVASLTAVQKAEQVLQTFSADAEANVENALMKVFGNLSIQKLDAIYAELAKKGGNMETKLASVSVEVFAMEDVATASESIANVLQSASSMLQYGVAKLNAENNVKDMSAVKTILDRAKFMKMGQQAMASGSNQPQNVANTGDVPM